MLGSGMEIISAFGVMEGIMIGLATADGIDIGNEAEYNEWKKLRLSDEYELKFVKV